MVTGKPLMFPTLAEQGNCKVLAIFQDKENNLIYIFFFHLDIYILGKVKFVFSKKATKIDVISTVDWTLYSKCQIYCEGFVIFCDLLRKHEL